MATGEGHDLTAITDARGADGGVPHGAALTGFVDAVLGDNDAVLAAARGAVRRAVGDAAFVDVCATVASFNAVVKIADGSGIPLEEAKEARTRDIRKALSIDAFRT
jgi:hypothetical protein